MDFCKPEPRPSSRISHLGPQAAQCVCLFGTDLTANAFLAAAKGRSTLGKALPLPVFDRRTGRVIQEFMDDSSATYESRPHQSLMQWLGSSPTWDWLVAAYQNTSYSARNIEPFIRKYHIDMTEFEPGPFKSYAEFFDRRFLPGKRHFPDSPGQMGAFAEARYLAWEKLAPEMEFPIKGHSLKPEILFGNAERAKEFEGGPGILARLSPMDYHHLHYVDSGRTIDTWRLGSRYGRLIQMHCVISLTSFFATSGASSCSKRSISAGSRWSR